eukprot:g34341.t1
MSPRLCSLPFCDITHVGGLPSPDFSPTWFRSSTYIIKRAHHFDHGVQLLRRFREHDDIICVEETPQLPSGSRSLGAVSQPFALFRQHFSKCVNEDKKQDWRKGVSL